jgi:hypothetical protein
LTVPVLLGALQRKDTKPILALTTREGVNIFRPDEAESIIDRLGNTSVKYALELMKFEFIRMHEPDAPSWDHADPDWRPGQLPGLDLSAVWRRQWDWLRGAR